MENQEQIEHQWGGDGETLIPIHVEAPRRAELSSTPCPTRRAAQHLLCDLW